MARGRRFIRNNQGGGVGSFDPDARRMLAIDARHDPKDRPVDGVTTRDQNRNDARDYQGRQTAQRVIMPARPLLCHCGSKEFYMRGLRWTCAKCQPQQPAQAVEAREVVTIPANISTVEARELAQGWQLVNQKRAADGLKPLPAITKTKQKKAAQKTPAKICPVNVTFYSLMGIEAARRGSGTGGVWRLWVLYNALDHKDCDHKNKICNGGRGHIKRDSLRAFVLSLGVSRATFTRWYSDGLRLEIFKESLSAAGDWFMVFANAGIIGAALGCVDGVGRRVTMRAGDLVGSGWKARVFAALEVTHNGKPIARETMQKKYNVARSTQQYREARAGVKKITNIAKLNKGADYLPGVVEYDRKPGAFFVDRDGVLNRRLPNSYQYKGAELSRRGRGKKVNRIIRGIIQTQQQSNLSLMGQVQSFIDADESEPTRETIRLYNLTPDEVKRSKKKIQHNDPRHKITGIYQYQRKARRSAHVVYWFYIVVGG